MRLRGAGTGGLGIAVTVSVSGPDGERGSTIPLITSNIERGRADSRATL